MSQAPVYKKDRPSCKICGRTRGQVEALYPAFGREGGFLCNHCAVISGGSRRKCEYCKSFEKNADELLPHIYQQDVLFICRSCAVKICGEENSTDSPEKLIEHYYDICERDPGDSIARLRLAALLLRADRTAEATQQYLEAGDRFERRGYYSKAIAVYKTVMSIRRDLTSLYHMIAECYSHIGYNLDALYYYRGAAQLFEQQGRMTEAVLTWERIVAGDPANMSARHKLAELLYQCGWEEEALDGFHRLRDMLIESGREDQLIGFYKKMLKIIPDAIEEICLLARCYLDAGETEEAFDLLQAQIERGISDSTIYDLYAEARIAISRPKPG
jgi:tetratricopeptide (TPR) repeat protein